MSDGASDATVPQAEMPAAVFSVDHLELELLRQNAAHRAMMEPSEHEEDAGCHRLDSIQDAPTHHRRMTPDDSAMLQCPVEDDAHHQRVPEDDPHGERAVLLGRDITQEQLGGDNVRDDQVIVIDAAPCVMRITFAVIPVFMGYAVLLSLQERLRSHLGITSNASGAAQSYQFGVSLIFIGDLVFRLSHNVLLSWLRPRSRVYFAYLCMCLSMSTIVVTYYIVNSPNMSGVYASYLIGGVGIGTFETNIVSCITPLGPKTKEAAIIGMPLGYNGISIGAFALFALAPSSATLEVAVFGLVLLANIVAVLIFSSVPDVRFEASEDDARKFFSDVLHHWRTWLPLTWSYLACMFINMFGVILMSGVVLYIFNTSSVQLVPAAGAPSIPKDAFLMVYNTCAFLGDFTSRKIAYRLTFRLRPVALVALLIVGIGLGLCRVAVLAWLGMFLVMFANGALYAATTKYVDETVPLQFNLVVLSLWLFIGDCGSFIASDLTDYVASAVG